MQTKYILIILTIMNCTSAQYLIAAPMSPQDYFSNVTISGELDYNSGQIGSNSISHADSGCRYFVTTATWCGGGSGSATRSLGQLKASAGATWQNTAPGQGDSYGYAVQALSSFGDTLFFTNAGASTTDITTINFSARVDGTLSTKNGIQGPGSGLPGGGLFLAVGEPLVFGQFAPTPVNVETTYLESVNWYMNEGTMQLIDHNLSGSISFYGTAAFVPIYMQLYAHGQYGFANLSNTASFVFDDIPDGVAFTSASGDFLSGAVPSVPLPGSLHLHLLAIGGLVAFGLRGNRLA